MKRIISFICCLSLVLFFAINCTCADIDGVDSGVEWDGATVYKLVDGQTNCGVNFGLVKVKFDNSVSAVYMCFMFIDPTLEIGNTSVGVSLTIENSEPFVLTVESSPLAYDYNKYSFDGAMSVDENNGATCEIRLGIKEGLPKYINGRVRFIDDEGVPSNHYSFTLVNEEYEEETPLIIAPTADNRDPAYNPNLLTEKQTKAKTTKKTTEKRTTTKKNVIKTSPPYSYTGQTTKNQQKTTKKATAAKAPKPPGVTVYYYEKEVIISQVIVTQTVTDAATVSESVTQGSDISAEISENKITISKGTKYKTAVGAAGAVAFLSIAACAARGSVKSNKKDKSAE